MPASRTTTPRNKQLAAKKTKKGVSSASDFKKKDKGIELELPSGEVCLIKRPGVEGLIADGVFSDRLLPVIQKSIDAAKGGKSSSVDIDGVMADTKLMADIMQTYDKVCAKVVIAPKVVLHRRETEPGVWEDIPDEERDDEKVYTDEVDLDDKIFIFQFVMGGSDDLARFREQLESSMAAVPDGEVV